MPLLKFRSLDEKTLLERCLKQDKKAWDVFVDRYHRIISHAIVHTLRKYSFGTEHQVIDDLFHTVFLSLIEHNYKKLREFQWKCKLSSWLHIISVRTTIDFLRKQTDILSLNGETNEELSLKEGLTNGNPKPDEIVEMEEEKTIFNQIKTNLKTREQFFVELYYCRELSSPEVAKIMNITENNVYQMKSRVREKLKSIAEKYL